MHGNSRWPHLLEDHGGDSLAALSVLKYQCTSFGMQMPIIGRIDATSAYRCCYLGKGDADGIQDVSAITPLQCCTVHSENRMYENASVCRESCMALIHELDCLG